MITHYLKVAWRNMLKHKSESAISIIGLAVGILSFSFCMYWTRFITDTDKFFTNYDRLAEVVTLDNEYATGLSAINLNDFKQHNIRGIDSYTTTHFYDSEGQNLTFELSENESMPYDLFLIEIDSCFFKTFSIDFLSGSLDVNKNAPNRIILTKKTADRIFGDKYNPIGTKVTLNGETGQEISDDTEINRIYTVIGVVPDFKRNNSLSNFFEINALVINDSNGFLHNEIAQRSRSGCKSFALLNTITSIDKINDAIEKADITITSFGESKRPVFRQPGNNIYPFFPAVVKILTVIAFLILLSAFINFLMFKIGTFYNRSKEYFIRKGVGAQKRHLFGMLLTEITFVLIITGILICCLIEWILPYSTISIQKLQFEIQPKELFLHIAEYFVLLWVICTIICAFTTRKIIRSDIESGIRIKSGKPVFRNILLCIQFLIGFLFFSVALALQLQSQKTGKEIYHTLSKAEKDAIFDIPLSQAQLQDKAPILMQRFRTNSRIKDILESSGNIIQNSYTSVSPTPEFQRDRIINTNLILAGNNFAPFFNIPLTKGILPQNESFVLIDQTLTNRLDSVNAGPKIYFWGGKEYEVCGIFDKIVTDIHKPNSGLIIFSPEIIRRLYVKAHAGYEKEVHDYLVSELKKILPSSVKPPQILSLSEAVNKEFQIELFFLKVIASFAAVSLIISLLGIYSAITLETERRQKEVAIRKINGATVMTIIVLFGKLYFVLFTTAFLIALPVLIFLIHFWQQLYATPYPFGVVFYLSVYLFIAAIVFATVFWKILLISKINPAEAIRKE